MPVLGSVSSYSPHARECLLRPSTAPVRELGLAYPTLPILVGPLVTVAPIAITYGDFQDAGGRVSVRHAPSQAQEPHAQSTIFPLFARPSSTPFGPRTGLQERPRSALRSHLSSTPRSYRTQPSLSRQCLLWRCLSRQILPCRRRHRHPSSKTP